jgi:hypothetical protein
MQKNENHDHEKKKVVTDIFSMLSALQFSVDVTVEGNDAGMRPSHVDVLVVDMC